MGKKADKKKKAPPLLTSEPHLQPFGVRANDIMRSPLGMIGHVMGVKYASAEDVDTMQEHIRRDMDAHSAMLDAMEEERVRAEAEARLRAVGEEPAAAGKAGKGKKK